MAETSNQTSVVPDSQPADPLASLHKMSTTAGVGSTDYVAINSLAVTSVVIGLASVAAWLSVVLLIIPVVGITFAVFALRQIIGSNGTQTGKGLAIVGLVLSLGIAAAVLANTAIETAQYNRDTAEIDKVVGKLGGFMNTGNYDAAYGLFTDKFHERVSKENFIQLMKQAQQSPRMGRVVGMKSNQRLSIQFEPNLKLRVAIGMILIDWEKADFDGREEFKFEQIDGNWLIHDIPSFFPAPGQGPQ